MSKVVIKQSQLSQILSDPNGPLMKDLERRAQNVLQRARELVPNASGDFARSLRIVKTTQRGKPVVRIVSTDPQVQEIRQGTPGPYTHQLANISRLSAWAAHRGIDTSPRNIHRMARGIAKHGTSPAGTYGGGLTVDEALKEAVKEARR